MLFGSVPGVKYCFLVLKEPGSPTVFLEPGESIDLVSFIMPSITGTQEHALFFACVQPDIALFVEPQLLPVQSSF